jgi:hypothetical protein
MKFKSKAHMAQELIAGKRFKTSAGTIIYYNDELVNPFRCEEDEMSGIWDSYILDIWTELKSPHIHQYLIDSYREGQAWQYTTASLRGLYLSIKNQDEWVEPSWDECIVYRLHPHNELIQEHRNGAKIQTYVCGSWIEEYNPDWYEDSQYRVKPNTKTVYEWMFMSKLSYAWELEALLLSEEGAGEFYGDAYKYRKTGRSWEVEV